MTEIPQARDYVPMKNWEQTLASTLETRWRRYRTRLKRCQRKFSESSIHASRIEARRLAAQLELLRVFAGRRELRKAQRALKRHLDAFDALRDAQVQLTILKREGRVGHAPKALRKLAEKRERQCREHARERIVEVTTGRQRRLVRSLIKRLGKGAKNPQRMWLDRRNIIQSVDVAFSRLMRCRRRMDARDVSTIHRLRIAFKRFRYMMEPMRLLFPEIRRSQLETMRAFQALLGDLQDTDVFLARVDRLIARERIDADEVAAFRNWLVRRRAAQAQRCVRRAAVVSRFWPLKSSLQIRE